MSLKELDHFSQEQLSRLIKNPKVVTLKISDRLQAEIQILCQKVQKNCEWSGTLFYKIIEGDFEQEQCVLLADRLYLQDIGNSVYTEYQYKPEYFKYLMDNPELLDYKVGHIHSHHDMQVFFSGTDNMELMDNAPNHNHYLSLIINNKNEMVARIAYVVKEKLVQAIEFKDTNGNKQTVYNPLAESKTQPLSKTYYYDCKIVKPDYISFVNSRMNDILASKPKSRFEYNRDVRPRQFERTRFSTAEKQVSLFDEEFLNFDTPVFHRQLKQTKINSSQASLLNQFVLGVLLNDKIEADTVGEALDYLDERFTNEPSFYSEFIDDIPRRCNYFYNLVYKTNHLTYQAVLELSINTLKDYSDVYGLIVDPLIAKIQKDSSK